MSDEFNQTELAVVRRAYARQMLARAGIDDFPRLESAFATVPREDFLGPPPWYIGTSPRASREITEPVALYQDAVIVLDRDRGVNNGSPSLHAAWLHALGAREGETVVHLGAGSGYYTAILARLVGAGGRVVAVEYDGRLAALARANLARYPNIEVVHGNGITKPDTPTDCIYVNFGVERPAAVWIEGLRDGGRLIFPLGYRKIDHVAGGGFRITRKGDGFAARYLGHVYFIGAEGVGDESDEYRARLEAAFKTGMAETVATLLWSPNAMPQNCWFAADGWALCCE